MAGPVPNKETVPIPMARPVPNKETIRREFASKNDARVLTIRDIERELAKALKCVAPVPTIKSRTKDFESYYKKYIRQLISGVGSPRVTDLMGIRIICPFLENLPQVQDIIGKKFRVIEVEEKRERYSLEEFGYESTHLLIEIPKKLLEARGDVGCSEIEIQMRTTMQDAWAEVEHEVLYKAEFTPLGMTIKRKLAAVSASLFLADTIFQEIRSHQKDSDRQLTERRRKFYQEIESSLDAFIPLQMQAAKLLEPASVELELEVELSSTDDLLLKALTSHNSEQFDDAVATYNQILEFKKPEKKIRSLIYKHRGLAYFAQSKYDEAAGDFTSAFELDKASYTSVYHRGLVHSVQGRYREAIGDFTLSLEINPCQHYCLFRRGEAHYHLGDYAQALSDCGDSLSMEPNNERAKAFRELVLSRLQA